MIHYDNIKDAADKLASTICYYNGNAVNIRDVSVADPEKPFKPGDKIKLALQIKGSRTITYCYLDDPGFSFRGYNLGYANYGGVAAWWYRKPLKQYKQGLRSDQMGRTCSNMQWYDHCRFDFNQSIVSMLENQYPSITTCENALRNKEAECMAFHKDFALSYDRLHDDFIVEYRGKVIGQTNKMVGDYKLLPEFEHLHEALQEARA